MVRFKAGAWLLWFVVTGSLFLVAAIAKSIQSHSFFEVARYLGVGQSALSTVWMLIVALEAGLGAWLLFGRRSRLAVILTVSLLGVYTAILFKLITGGAGAPSCSCIGMRLSATAQGEHVLGIIRNIVLIAWGVWVVASGGARLAPVGRPTPGDVERSRSGSGCC